RSSNASLELRVQERTQQLSATNLELTEEVKERKRTEARLQAYADKLEKSNQELQDFAYVASHDLQEPLRKIQAFGDRLNDKCGDLLTDQGRDYLERMQNASGRMQTLINDLLTFSRVTTKANPFAAVMLNDTIQGVLSDLETQIEQVQGQIEVGTLPTLEADPTQMRQLFQNLISNALKFHRSSVPPVIKIKSHTFTSNIPASMKQVGQQEFCQIQVIDNGIGFDEKYLDRIFIMFQRLHSRSEYEGTGVGLAICRKIVERHSGSITATSVPGEGTTFLVILPIQQALESQTP
ncbi:MAG: ATP-binding protein, partial [Leptolyngbyaceae bacterium]|nr:ATP-binding protein [Leptolyngbyaceae bacterium]